MELVPDKGIRVRFFGDISSRAVVPKLSPFCCLVLVSVPAFELSPRNCKCPMVVQVCGGGGGVRSGVRLGPMDFATVNVGTVGFGGGGVPDGIGIAGGGGGVKNG